MLHNRVAGGPKKTVLGLNYKKIKRKKNQESVFFLGHGLNLGVVRMLL